MSQAADDSPYLHIKQPLQYEMIVLPHGPGRSSHSFMVYASSVSVEADGALVFRNHAGVVLTVISRENWDGCHLVDDQGGRVSAQP